MEERWVEVGRARLWTAAEGDGLPLLMLSGGPGSPDTLWQPARELSAHYRPIRVELRGCGRSSDSRDLSLSRCLGDLEAVRKAYGVERWVVLGHSWGVNLALAYALEHSRNCLGLVGLAGGVLHKDKSWERCYQNGRESEARGEPEWGLPIHAHVQASLNREWSEYVQRPTLLADIAALDLPALLLYGSEDIRPAWPTRQLAELLPRGRFQLLQGARHILWATHGLEMQRELKAFLDGLGPAS